MRNDNFWQNIWHSETALPSNVESLTAESVKRRGPAYLFSEGFGSRENARDFLLLEGAVN